MHQNVPHSKATEISNTNKERRPEFFTREVAKGFVYFITSKVVNMQKVDWSPKASHFRFLVERDIPLKYPEEIF